MKGYSTSLSKNGLPILKVNGVSLCSNYAPDVEARRWVEQYRRLIEPTQVCFILGLGCGYHCSEAAFVHPNIQFIVLEKEVEVSNWFWKHTQRQVDNLSVVSLKKTKTIESWLPFASDLEKAFGVLTHGPSMQIEHEYYSSIQEFLLARDFDSYQQQRSLGGTFSQRLPEVARTPTGYGINVQNILQSIDPQAGESHFDRIWDTLGELVR